MQYSLRSKRQNAHDESIWTCAWGRLILDGPEKDNLENENNSNNTEEANEKSNERRTADIIATGGVDDLVKVWEYTSDGEMKLKHKLSEHSLGVVSVDLSKDAKQLVSSSLDSSIHVWDVETGHKEKIAII